MENDTAALGGHVATGRQDGLSCPGCGNPATKFRFAIGRDRTLPLFECLGCGLHFAPAPNGDRERHSAPYHDARARQMDGRQVAAEATLMLAYWAKRLHWTGRERMLEVGCAEGALLEAARMLGHRMEGIDISPYYAQRWKDRGLPAAVATVEEYSAGCADGMDVVIARQLFEHLAQPLSFLQACARVLRRGGVCLIETGDSRSVEARVLGRRWAFWEPGEGIGAHVSFLNAAAARRLGAMAGLPFIGSVPYGRYRTPPEASPFRSVAAAWRWLKYGAHRTWLTGGKCYVFRKGPP